MRKLSRFDQVIVGLLALGALAGIVVTVGGFAFGSWFGVLGFALAFPFFLGVMAMLYGPAGAMPNAVTLLPERTEHPAERQAS